MNKIKVIGLGLFFSLFFVACTTSSSSSPTPTPEPAPPGEKQTLSASSERLSFTFGETDFKTSEVTSNKAGKGKYSASSNNKAVATAISNSVGLVRVTPIGVGDAIITVTRERDSSYDSASQTIEISVNKQKQYLVVHLGANTSDRWKLSNGAEATISVAAVSLGGVRGDSDDLVGSTASYSITKIESSTTGDQKVVAASVNPAGEIIITAKNIGDATVTVSNKGDVNYSKSDDVAIFITVNKDATQAALNFTSTDGSTTDVTFDGYGKTASKTITVTGGSAGGFIAESSYPVTVQFDNNVLTITPIRVGKGVITVTRQGGDSGGTIYNPISKDIRVTVNKPAAQTLSVTTNSFEKIYNEGVDTADSQVEGSSSTGDYYIESSKSDVATASIDALGAITVLFEQVGTTGITITRAGDYYYRSSSTAKIDVTVDKAPQQLTARYSSVEGDGRRVVASIKNGEFVTSYTSLARRALFIVKGEGDGPFENPKITNNTDNPNKGVVTKAVINREIYYDPMRDETLLSDLLKLTLGQAGTTDIKVEKQGDRNYLAGKRTIRVNIAKAPHTISIEGNETDFELKKDTVAKVQILGGKGDGDYTTPPLVVSTPVAPEAVVASASIAGNELTLTALELGSAEVTFRKNGDRNYANSNEVTIDVEVTTLENQVITSTKRKFTALYADEIPTQDY